jgi:hypothetical protein
LARRVPAALIAAERRIKRWIKQTPALWDAASRVRERLGALRADLRPFSKPSTRGCGRPNRPGVGIPTLACFA